jgi:hypothetical protein
VGREGRKSAVQIPDTNCIDPILTPNAYPKFFVKSVSNSRRYSYLKLLPRCLILRRILSRGYQTPRKFILSVIRALFRGVWYPAEMC